MKKAYLIHGWDGFPENHWFPWLKKELEKRGFTVMVPAMPNPATPRIAAWVSFLEREVGNIDEETFFIGHSIGCQTIMRFLEKKNDCKVGGIVFIAGFFHLPNLETEEEKRIAREWLETPIDTQKIKECTKNIVAIFSDDDPDVPLSDAEIFRERLNAKIKIEQSKGHFTLEKGVDELPVVLESIEEMTRCQQ